jgi:hypothetical protein
MGPEGERSMTDEEWRWLARGVSHEGNVSEALNGEHDDHDNRDGGDDGDVGQRQGHQH